MQLNTLSTGQSSATMAVWRQLCSSPTRIQSPHLYPRRPTLIHRHRDSSAPIWCVVVQEVEFVLLPCADAVLSATDASCFCIFRAATSQWTTWTLKSGSTTQQGRCCCPFAHRFPLPPCASFPLKQTVSSADASAVNTLAVVEPLSHFRSEYDPKGATAVARVQSEG